MSIGRGAAAPINNINGDNMKFSLDKNGKLNTEQITSIINYMRKHITFETLDDVYTDEEKRKIVSHCEELEKEHNQSLHRAGRVGDRAG